MTLECAWLAVHSAFADTNWLELSKLLVSILTLASIVIAYRSYRANLTKQNDDRIRERDKELLLQVQKSFQWAFDVLTDEGKEAPPKANRLNWLTSARHLLRTKKIADQISSETYRTVFEEIEEYWRHKFYIALSDEQLRSWTYYADQSNLSWPENIEISSALVILDFSNWKKDAPDPLKEMDREALIANRSAFLCVAAGRGLEAYMVRFEEIKAKRNAAIQPTPTSSNP